MTPEDILKLCEIGNDRFLRLIVPQDFEDWPMITTNSFDDSTIACGGVYLLIRDREVIYVGQSHNVRQRLHSKQHKISKDSFNKIVVYPIADTKLRWAAEQAFIYCFDPANNKKTDRNFYWIRRTVDKIWNNRSY